jgi:hypothetical protein
VVPHERQEASHQYNHASGVVDIKVYPEVHTVNPDLKQVEKGSDRKRKENNPSRPVPQKA